MNREKKTKHSDHRSLCAFLAAAMLLPMLLAGCSEDVSSRQTDPAETAEMTEAPTQSVAVEGNGDEDSLNCKGSYSSAQEDIDPNVTVATMNGAELTNLKLRFYYNLEIAAFQRENHGEMPDFTQPLENQLCPLAEVRSSWQQYFLQRALNSWYVQEALILSSQEPQPAADPYFIKRTELYADYFDPSLPAAPLIYGDRDFYTPNEMHQAYLDEVPELLQTLSQAVGMKDADALAKSLAGNTATADDLFDYAWRLNYGYFYFTEKSYDLKPTQEQVDEYYNSHAGDYSSEEGKTVNVRNLLIRPLVCQVAEDGTVTADEAYWNSCNLTAQTLLANWKGSWLTHRDADGSFGGLANEKSVDESTRADGGLYVGLHQGQLMPELDAWVFAPDRQAGDTTAIRSQYGYHILYIQSINESGKTQARKDLIQEMAGQMLEEMKAAFPMTVDYSKISLYGTPCDLTADDLLYPDVAHERFPSAIVYLQQDFQTAPYGNYNVSSHGCGITTLAMLATYLTDDQLTPAYLAGRYGSYCLEHGTNADIMRQVPPELGFYLEKYTSNWSEVEQALDDGKVVVSLQHLGHFTSGGHYLLLTERLEDGNIVVRDSNVYNYAKLPGHKVDYFEPGKITANNILYWIFEPKRTRISICDRCGDPANSGALDGVLTGGYLCEICERALQRREEYMRLNIGE